MRFYLRIAFSLFIVCSCFSIGSCQSNNLKIVFIRHGEKPDEGTNLTCQGINRSLQIPKVITAKFGVPSVIFVPAIGSGEKTRTSRMFQTATPLAVKYNLTVNSSHDENSYGKLAEDLKNQKGTVLVVWEHKAIKHVLKALGVENVPEWSDSDFDSIDVITFRSGKALLTKDKEGIKPAAGCPF